MGKRTLRTLHFEMVAGVLKRQINYWGMDPGERDLQSYALHRVASRILEKLTNDFADEFEIRAESFDRSKFLRACGLEGE